MAQHVVWQQAGNKLVYDDVTTDFNFITAGYLKRNGLTIGQASTVFDGTPIQANFTVTGDLGAGVFLPRTVTLGDRADLRYDVVLGSLAGTQTYLLPVGKKVRQNLLVSAQSEFGGYKTDGATPQYIKLKLAGINDGPVGTNGTLQDVTVNLIDTLDNTVVSTTTIPAISTPIATTDGVPTAFSTYDVWLSYAVVSAAQAARLALEVSGGSHIDTGVTHNLVFGYHTTDVLSGTTAEENNAGVLTDLGFDLAFSLEHIEYILTSIGAVNLLGKVTADVEMAPGVKVDGVDLSVFYQTYQTAVNGLLTDVADLAINKENTIQVAAVQPSSPALHDKWIDTSTPASPVLRQWDGATWSPVGSSGPNVDVTYRDLTIRNIYMSGQFMSDVGLAPGAKVGGIDLLALKQQLDGFTAGTLAETVTVSQVFTSGQFTNASIHLDQPNGTVEVVPLSAATAIAQSFQTNANGSIVRIRVKMQSDAVAGTVTLRLRRGTPTDVTTDTILATSSYDIVAVDANERYYDFNLPEPIVALKDQPYYFDLTVNNGAQVRLVSSATDQYANGQKYTLSGTTWTAAGGDYSFTLELGTTPQGQANIIGDMNLFGNLNIYDGTLNYISTVLETLNIQDNSITLNSNVVGVPVFDGSIIFNRGASQDAIILWDETLEKFDFNFPVILNGTDFDTFKTTTLAALASLQSEVDNVEAQLATNVYVGLGFNPDGTKPDFDNTSTYLNTTDSLFEAIENLDDALALEINNLLAIINNQNVSVGLNAGTGEKNDFLSAYHYAASANIITAVEALDTALWNKLPKDLGKDSAGTILATRTFAWYAGTVRISGTVIPVPAGIIVLPANEPQVFVQCDGTGTVVFNTTGFTTNAIPMALAVTDATSITALVDRRPWLFAQETTGVVYGASVGTACEGNDPRLSNARTALGTSPIAGDVTGTLAGSTVEAIQNVPVSSAVPGIGDTIAFTGTEWAPRKDYAAVRMQTATTAGTPTTAMTVVGAATPNLALPANATSVLKVSLAGRSSPGTLDGAVAFTFEFCVHYGTTGAQLSGIIKKEELFRTPDDLDVATWDAAVSVNGSNELVVTVTGSSAVGVSWIAKVETTEVLLA